MEDRNDSNIGNKNIRNLDYLEAFLLKAEPMSKISPSSCLQSSDLVQLRRYSCRYLTFGTLNFYLSGFILPLRSFSVGKQTHFPCLVPRVCTFPLSYTTNLDESGGGESRCARGVRHPPAPSSPRKRHLPAAPPAQMLVVEGRTLGEKRVTWREERKGQAGPRYHGWVPTQKIQRRTLQHLRL